MDKKIEVGLNTAFLSPVDGSSERLTDGQRSEMYRRDVSETEDTPT